MGEVRKAFTMDEESFKAKYGRPKPSKEDDSIVFTCRSGARSLEAVEEVRAEGYTK